MNQVDGVPSTLIIDPRINIDEEPHYYIEKGASYVRYDQNISTSYSNSSFHFSVVPPNKNVGVDKKIYIDVAFRFDFTGDAGAGNVMLPSVTVGGVEYLAGNTDALRYMAFQQIVESLAIQFNQSTVSQNLSDYVEALTRAGFRQAYEASDLSIAPSMHDQFQELGDWITWGSARNPLAAYGENSAQQPRGALQGIINSNTQTAAQVDFRWSELLIISPLLFSKMEEKSFIGLTNLDFTFNLGNLSRMWCHDAVNNDWTDGGAVPTINVSVLEAPKLRLCFLTPPITEEIPLINRYPYHEVNRYPTASGASLAPGTSTKISGNNVQLSSIPKRIFLFARERNQDRDYTKADAYARIDSINIQFDNKNALLGSATSRDLYEISVRNGLQMSWAQWNYFCGSVCVIDFGHDISLSDYQAVGMSGQYQIQIDLDITNVGSNAKNYTMYMVVISEGVFSLEGTASRLEVGNVLPQNVLEGIELKDLERRPYHEQYDYIGGSFLGFLKRVGSKLAKAAHKGLKLAHKAVPFVEKGLELGKKYLPKAIGAVEKVAPLLMAAGYSEDQIARAITSLPQQGLGAGLKGGVMPTGGRKMARKSLRNRR